MENNELLQSAKEALKGAYVPYSQFPVGAALLAKSGKVYTGCNIENASYPLTCCAERVAIFKAISNGERQFSKMVVVADTDRPVPPCGACRQVMNEFFDAKMPIYLANQTNEIKLVNIESLLPFSFQPTDLNENRRK
ncbi:MAG TPA: cytidine deaminase [Cerasibacillus sp.]|uniref:cytidine deaminase n=1 Tax=Cerasibacillus sp. TaxID=2498711 RepID=UPI002F4215D5